MENIEEMNNITLEFLLNPSLYEKISQKKPNSHEKVLQEILFYRRRINHMTKEMCKGKFMDDTLKRFFFNYANSLVYYLKQLDEKDILQEEYNDLNLKNNIKGIINDTFKEQNYDKSKIIYNQDTKNYNLDKFVKKINTKTVEKILPQQRIANIKNPELKKKGLKKKISE